jgi:hypothetical protein
MKPKQFKVYCPVSPLRWESEGKRLDKIYYGIPNVGRKLVVANPYAILATSKPYDENDDLYLITVKKLKRKPKTKRVK